MCENLDFFFKNVFEFRAVCCVDNEIERSQTDKKTIQNTQSVLCILSFLFSCYSVVVICYIIARLVHCIGNFHWVYRKKYTGRIDYLLKKHEERFSDAEFVIKPVTKPIYEDKPEHRAEIILSHPISAERISIASILCKSYLLQI